MKDNRDGRRQLVTVTTFVGLIGQPRITVEEFIEENRALFELRRPTAAA